MIIEYITPFLIFLVAGALDGVRDAISDSKFRGRRSPLPQHFAYEKIYPEAFCFLLRFGNWGTLIYRWLMRYENAIKVPRIKIGKLVNIPLDGWHVCKTLCYSLLAFDHFLGMNWTMLVICWGIVRPISQNIIQWSCLYNRWTFHKGLF